MFAVVPNDGVPPANVLAVQFPDLTLSERQTLSSDDYTDLKAELAAEVLARQNNLNSTNSRKKRDVKNINRNKRAAEVDLDKFGTFLQAPDVVYGIYTPGGSLDGAYVCECPPPAPTSKVRKVMETTIAWSDEMKNLKSQKFIDFKMKFEEKVMETKKRQFQILITFRNLLNL